MNKVEYIQFKYEIPFNVFMWLETNHTRITHEVEKRKLRSVSRTLRRISQRKS